MKGIIGLIFLGICLVVAAAIVVGAITFPEAITFLMGILWWVVLIIIIIAVIFIIIFVILAVS